MTTACSQLRLPFAAEGPPPDLEASAAELLELNAALRVLLDVAEGRCRPIGEGVARVRHALAVLARTGAGGRLGHVVRHYGGESTTAARWEELANELAFAISLFREPRE